MDTLSDEILIHIFAQGTAKEISLWRRVSCQWNVLINDDFVWRTAFRNFWDNKQPITRVGPDSWKDEYMTRMNEINKMSNRKPSAVRICTKKSEIQDICIKSNSDNTLVKILDLKGLTNAHVRLDGSLNQKFILFFDCFFGISPISSAQFIDDTSMVLGLTSGDFIVYDKIPSKSLTENYFKCDSMLPYHAPVVKVIPQNDKSLLIVHGGDENCFEFAKWTFKNGEYSQQERSPLLPNVKLYTPIHNELGDIVKIAFVDLYGKLFLNSFTLESKEIAVLDVNAGIILKQIQRSDWLILVNYNKISILNHCTEKIISSFTLSRDFKGIKGVNYVGSGTIEQQLEFIVLAENGMVLKLEIDILQNQIKQEIIIDFSDPSDFNLISIHVTPIYFILINSNAIYVYDTLSLRRINKCSYPKYFLKSISSEHFDIKIESLGENKFLFVWGKSLAQIWDFNAAPKTSRRQIKPKSADIDKGILGGKAIRKYTQYDLNSGLSEWTQERQEEDHLDYLRGRLNIHGLNEEEMIAYAKLLSVGREIDEMTREQKSDDNYSVASDDPDLIMALQLSLIEM